MSSRKMKKKVDADGRKLKGSSPGLASQNHEKLKIKPRKLDKDNEPERRRRLPDKGNERDRLSKERRKRQPNEGNERDRLLKERRKRQPNEGNERDRLLKERRKRRPDEENERGPISNRSDIAAMLKKEPDRAKIIELISLENSENANLIRQLYDLGANTGEIKAMLKKEPDAKTLMELTRLEKAKSPRLIRQLYDDGATSEQIRVLIKKEPNAQTLHNQIKAEKTKKPDQIKKLYENGATSEEITAMLKINSDAEAIQKLMQTTNVDFKPENILFTSMDDGKIGSIYFPVGRIRLVHDSGPEVFTETEYDKIERFTVSQEDYERYRIWKKENPGGDKYDYFTKLSSAKRVDPDELGNVADGKLMEFLYDNGGTRLRATHPSRGGPVKFDHNLKQHQLNIIYNISHAAEAKIAGPKAKVEEYRERVIYYGSKVNQYKKAKEHYAKEYRAYTAMIQQYRDIGNRQRIEISRLKNERDAKYEDLKDKVERYKAEKDEELRKEGKTIALAAQREFKTLQQQYNGAKAVYENTVRRHIQAQSKRNEANRKYTTVNTGLDKAFRLYQRNNQIYQEANTRLKAIVGQANAELRKWMNGHPAMKAIPIR